MEDGNRYYVAGDLGSYALEEVVGLLAEGYEEEIIQLTPQLDRATHILVIAHDYGEVQFAICRRDQVDPLPDLPVVVLLSDFSGLAEISLETAMGWQPVPPKGERHAF